MNNKEFILDYIVRNFNLQKYYNYFDLTSFYRNLQKYGYINILNFVEDKSDFSCLYFTVNLEINNVKYEINYFFYKNHYFKCMSIQDEEMDLYEYYNK